MQGMDDWARKGLRKLVWPEGSRRETRAWPAGWGWGLDRECLDRKEGQRAMSSCSTPLTRVPVARPPSQSGALEGKLSF